MNVIVAALLRPILKRYGLTLRDPRTVMTLYLLARADFGDEATAIDTFQDPDKLVQVARVSASKKLKARVDLDAWATLTARIARENADQLRSVYRNRHHLT